MFFVVSLVTIYTPDMKGDNPYEAPHVQSASPVRVRHSFCGTISLCLGLCGLALYAVDGYVLTYAQALRPTTLVIALILNAVGVVLAVVGLSARDHLRSTPVAGAVLNGVLLWRTIKSLWILLSA